MTSGLDRERRRRRREALSAVLAAIAIVAALLYVFARPSWSTPFHVRGVFTSSNQLQPGNPVRISGIDVGQVTAIDPGPANTSIVTMALDSGALPIHADATLAIEPRLALEGTFYVDLQPGSPSAPVLANGGIVPLAQTRIPVQLDQLFDVFDTQRRSGMFSYFHQLATGLGPTGSLDSGAVGFQQANREFARTLHSLTVVAAAAQGEQTGDLTRMIASSGHFFAQMAASPPTLADFVTNLAHVTGALAADDSALAETVRGLDNTLQQAPATLSSLDAAFPVLEHFSMTLTPSLRVAPGSLRAAAALIGQLNALSGPHALPSLLSALTPVVQRLPMFESQLAPLFRQVTPAARCVATKIVPGFDAVVPDHGLSTGRPAWQDMVHSWVNLAESSPTFDANGKAIRADIAEGDNALTAELPGLGQVVTGAAPKLEGIDPVWLGPGRLPAFRPDASCLRQMLPNLASRSSFSLFSIQPAARHGVRSTPRRSLKSLVGTLAAQPASEGSRR